MVAMLTGSTVVQAKDWAERFYYKRTPTSELIAQLDARVSRLERERVTP